MQLDMDHLPYTAALLNNDNLLLYFLNDANKTVYVIPKLNHSVLDILQRSV